MEEDHERHYGDFDPKDPDSYIALELMQSEFLEQSLHFASKAQKQFRERIGRNDRGVKQAGFLVLYRTTMPSVLHELGFISNPSEEDFLTSEQGKRKMASGLFRAFRGYKKHIDQRNSFDIKGQENIASADTGKEGKPVRKEESSSSRSDSGIRFKVQIAASSERRSLTPENFKGLSNVDAYLSKDSVHKYTVGNTGSYEEAERVEERVKESGYPGAFIIAFKDGERIDMERAMELAKRSEDR
jgi:N-acetylmuramoyl-L-alanine amidase